MNARRLLLSFLLVFLVLISFGVGYVWMVDEPQKNVAGLPLIGEWLADRLDITPDTTMVSEPTYAIGGVRKKQSPDGLWWYEISGLLAETTTLRVDGLLAGSVVVAGHLQAQPVRFLAGALDSTVYLGIGTAVGSTFRTRPSTEALAYMRQGARVVLTTTVDPAVPSELRVAEMFDALAYAMRHRQQVEDAEKLVFGVGKVEVQE